LFFCSALLTELIIYNSAELTTCVFVWVAVIATKGLIADKINNAVLMRHAAWFLTLF